MIQEYEVKYVEGLVNKIEQLEQGASKQELVDIICSQQAQLDAVRDALEDHSNWEFSAKSTIRIIKKALQENDDDDD